MLEHRQMVESLVVDKHISGKGWFEIEREARTD